MQHVATWKEGDEKWAYHEDAAANIATHKVSLDPYRLESRRIFACIKEFLRPKLQRLEKAGIDEGFLDLSGQVHSILLERYPELALPAPDDDPNEKLPLPRPEIAALDWKGDALEDLNLEGFENGDVDWDDITISIGSEVVRGIREAIRERLKYSCSAGIAQNKMLSKLGSAYRKPNQQTVIRNRMVQPFLSQFKFTKIRGLGGKTGENIVGTFNTNTVNDLLLVSVDQLKQKLGDEIGSWVYQTIRGVDHTEVNSRTQIKSMLSAKSFRPSINSYEQAARWLRIFASDIFSRLVEEGDLGHKRRPKSINLHHRRGGQMKSRQAPIPPGKSLDGAAIFDLAKSLLTQIIQEGQAWPCTNLSLSVSGFEDGITGNMGIGTFLVKGDEAKVPRSSARELDGSQVRSEKRQRLENGAQKIEKFFLSEVDTNGFIGETVTAKFDGVEEHDDDFGATDGGRLGVGEDEGAGHDPEADHNEGPTGSAGQSPVGHCICNQCVMHFDSGEALQNHQDWHFAKDLQEEYRAQSQDAAKKQATPTATKRRAGGQSKKRSGGLSRAEKGQSKLSFG